MTFRERQKARAARWKRLEGVDWSDVQRRLVVFARRRLGAHAAPAIAEDLASEAITSFLANAYDAWDPESVTLLRALGSIVNGLVANHRKTSARRGPPSDLDEALARASDGGDAAHDVEARDLARRTLAALEAELAGDALALAVLRATAEGAEMPKDQCHATGASMPDVLAARRRVERATRRTRAELEVDA